jgi:metal transporter CNNM
LNIIQGALKLKKMNVAEIMTKLEDVFSLPIKSVLNFDTLSLIQKSGFSRIPIYEQERSNIVAVLFAKDLAFVDPDDKASRLHCPLRSHSRITSNSHSY